MTVPLTTPGAAVRTAVVAAGPPATRVNASGSSRELKLEVVTTTVRGRLTVGAEGAVPRTMPVKVPTVAPAPRERGNSTSG